MLTQERLKEVTRYENGELVRIDYFMRGLPKIAGCVNSNGYVYVKIDGKQYRRSRLVWLYFHGVFPKDQIDHINGVRTDDRIENLREATRSENRQNLRKAQKNSKTGKLGVRFHGNEYCTDIQVDGERLLLGTFKAEEEASEAYLAAKRKYHPFNTL